MSVPALSKNEIFMLARSHLVHRSQCDECWGARDPSRPVDLPDSKKLCAAERERMAWFYAPFVGVVGRPGGALHTPGVHDGPCDGGCLP